MISKKGKFIVIYGANNLGKTTQTNLLANEMINQKLEVMRVKYPIYNLKPTGPQLYRNLRTEEGKKLTEKDMQIIFAQNRRDFEPTIKAILDAGINIVAEDYTGTGIAWGLTRDVPLNYLEKINKNLLKTDLSILIDGEHRFKEAIERYHRNEDIEDKLWELSRDTHRKLANRYHWEIVNGNQSIEKVHQNIMKIVKPILQISQGK